MDMQSARALRPGWELVEHHEGRLQLIFADHIATFKTPPVVKAVKALIEVLRTATPDHAVAELVDRAAALCEMDPGLVAHVLDLLDGAHCLYIPDPADHREAIDWFYAAAGDAPIAMRQKLARMEIAVVCSERSVGLIIQSAEAACLKIKAIEACAGDGITDVMMRLGAAHEAGAAMVAVFDFPALGGLATQINSFALAQGLPALYADCRTALADLGPYVLPGSGGCLECLNLRKLSNNDEAQQSAVAAIRQRHDCVVGDPQPAHPVFLSAIANLFICELADIAAAKPSRLLSSFIEIPQSGLLPSQHDYLRLPFCPCCGTKAPPRLAWNARFVSPEVKNEHSDF